MATMIKNFYKANEQLKEETNKIWALASHMTRNAFIEKIYLEEKVYLDGTTTPNKWFQFKEEIVYIHNSHNTLLPILNNAQFIEMEAMREANTFINQLYEMVMTLDYRMRETKENKDDVLKSGLENIKIVCTSLYCDMSMNELGRKTRQLQKKQKETTIKEIKNGDGKRWEIAECFQDDFHAFLKTEKETKTKQKNVSVIATNDEKLRWQEKSEKEIDEHREKIFSRNSNINTLEDWRNLEIYTKTILKDYSWLINYNRTKEKAPRVNDLEFLIRCIDLVKEKYNNTIQEEDLPEIMKHIETLCISNNINQTTKLLEELATIINQKQIAIVMDFLGQEHRILEMHVADFKEMDKKQEALYPHYQEALHFMNNPIEVDTHKI